MSQTPTLDIQPERDPLATIAVSAVPVVLEGRYRLLVRALWQLRHSRRTRWGLGLGSAAVMLVGVPDCPSLCDHFVAALARPASLARGSQIETAAPDLDWLSKGAFISVAGRQPAGVIYETCLVG